MSEAKNNQEPANNYNEVLANVLYVESLEFKYTQEMKSIIINDKRFEVDIQDFLGCGENKVMGCIWQTVGTVRTHLVNIKYANSLEELEPKIETAIKDLLLKNKIMYKSKLRNDWISKEELERRYQKAFHP